MTILKSKTETALLTQNQTETEPIYENPEPHSTAFNTGPYTILADNSIYLHHRAVEDA